MSTKKIIDKALKTKKPKTLKKENPEKQNELSKKKLLLDYLISMKEKPDKRRTLNSLVEQYKDRYTKFIEGLELSKYNKNIQDDNDITDYDDELESEVDENTANEWIETIKKEVIKEEDEKLNQSEDVKVNTINNIFHTIIEKIEDLNNKFETIYELLNDKKIVLINTK